MAVAEEAKSVMAPVTSLVLVPQTVTVAFGELLLTVLAMEVVPEVVVVAAAVGEVSVPPPMENLLVVMKAAAVEVGEVNLLVAAGEGAVKVAYLANARQDLDHLARFLMFPPPVVPE